MKKEFGDMSVSMTLLGAELKLERLSDNTMKLWLQFPFGEIVEVLGVNKEDFNDIINDMDDGNQDLKTIVVNSYFIYKREGDTLDNKSLTDERSIIEDLKYLGKQLLNILKNPKVNEEKGVFVMKFGIDFGNVLALGDGHFSVNEIELMHTSFGTNIKDDEKKEILENADFLESNSELEELKEQNKAIIKQNQQILDLLNKISEKSVES